MRVAVVGGGSTYTPELVDGFARLPFAVDEVVLVDPDAGRTAIVGSFGRRILARYGSATRLEWTSDLDAGLADADVVLVQLRVGGQATRIDDETFPLDRGCVGQETTGAGGLAKALRTVPVVLDIARRAPEDAWIVAFTNPVGIVTRALLDAGHRAVGLCNVAIGLQRLLARLLAVEPDDVVLDHVGLNHLTWERSATVAGVDRLPELIAGHGDHLAEHLDLPAELLSAGGHLPSYYLRYFYCHDRVVAEQRTSRARGARVAEIERELLAMYRDPLLDTTPELLSERGGAFYSEAAIGLVASLHGAAGTHAVDVRNRGTLPNLPDEAVVEVSCLVDGTGATPLPTAPLAPEHAGLVSHVAGYEELAVEAALKGGADRVFRALLAHPLVGQVDKARGLTDRLLAANAGFLPWAR